MLRQRERIRTLIAPLTDPDLEKPAFSHFFGVGFSTVGSALAGARQDAFSEDWELAQRLWRWDLTLPESVVHSGVAAYVRLMGSMVDREVARRIGHFTIVMDMPGYAGGAWTRLRQDGYLRQVVPGPDIGRTHARRRGHRRRRCRLTLDGPPMMGSTHLGGVLTTLRSRYRSVQINFDRVSAPIKPEPQGCRGAKRFV